MDGYAPRSPDLTGYKPQSPDLTSYRPQSPNLGHLQQNNSYAPQSPDLSGLQQFSTSADHHVPSYALDPPHQASQWNNHHNHNHHQQQHHTFSPQHAYQGLPPQQLHPQEHAHQYQDPYASYNTQHAQHSSSSTYGVHQPTYGSFPDPSMPAQTRNSNRTQPISYADPADSHEFEDSYPSFEPAPTVKQEVLLKQEPLPYDALPLQNFATQGPPPSAAGTPARRGRKPKAENQGSGGMNAPPALQKMDTGGVEVKTKFPTARIKRIMQADEDVGKVAQVTPVVVAKALELFMIRLITASADAAKARGSKKVMSQHMKAAVMQDEQFDNLRDIMTKIPDAPTKSTSGAGNDDDDDDVKAEVKPKGKGRGKKRRDSDDI